MEFPAGGLAVFWGGMTQLLQCPGNARLWRHSDMWENVVWSASLLLQLATVM